MAKIILDAFGGDNAPLEVIKGAAQAVEEFNVDIILTGKEDVILKTAKDNNISMNKIEIVDCPDIMPMDEEPTKLLKAYKDSSMAVGFRLLSEGKGDAFISAGSTGAVAVGATLVAKRIKGIKRPAITTVIPSENGKYVLLDSGANAECRPEMLKQFAVMGSIYAKKVLGIENPRVGLVNIGAEDTKGTPLQVETNAQLKAFKDINYIGNVEARQLPLGDCDVAVCDGFTGNIILKLTEGMGKMMKNSLNAMFKANPITLLGALCVGTKLKAFKKQFDYKEYGGAMLLGVRMPVVKAHGSSDARAFRSAIKQALQGVNANIVNVIEQSLRELESEKVEEKENE